MYLVSAYFDEHANKKLQRYIDEIGRVTGNTFMLDNNVPPHLTLAAVEARTGDELIDSFAKVADSAQPGKIIIPTVGQLLPYVMYAGVVLNDYLINMQRDFLTEIGYLKDCSINRFYQQNAWLPHITLGKTLSKEQMQLAFGVLQKSFSPLEARIVELGLADTNPHEDLLRVDI